MYFLVLFSIMVHGLSIPALELIYRWKGVKPTLELEPSMERRRSVSEALPPNSHVDPRCGSVVRHNRLSGVISQDGIDDLEEGWSRLSNVSFLRPVSRPVSRGRQMPDTPVWRLTGGSEDTLKDEEEKEAPKIQFLDERELRSPRSGGDVTLRAGDKDVGSAVRYLRQN